MQGLVAAEDQQHPLPALAQADQGSVELAAAMPPIPGGGPGAERRGRLAQDLPHPRRGDLAAQHLAPRRAADDAADLARVALAVERLVPDQRPRVEQEGGDDARVAQRGVKGPVGAGAEPGEHEPPAEPAGLELVHRRDHLVDQLEVYSAPVSA